MNEKESNIGRMCDLVDFSSVYSSMARQIILRTSFRDTLADYGFIPKEFPDVTMTMDMAKKLIVELQINVDAIKAGMEHPSLRFNL